MNTQGLREALQAIPRGSQVIWLAGLNLSASPRQACETEQEWWGWS